MKHLFTLLILSTLSFALNSKSFSLKNLTSLDESLKNSAKVKINEIHKK